MASKDNAKMEQDATNYFCGFNDDKLTMRCIIVARGLNSTFATESALSKYEKANNIHVGVATAWDDSSRGLDPEGNLREKLWAVFNEFYYPNDDILDTSTSNSTHVHKLEILGNLIAKEIVAKLPTNIDAAARHAKVDTTNQDLYRIYYHGLIKEIITVEFVKEILPKCYQNCHAQILVEDSKQASSEQAIQHAMSAAHKSNNMFAPSSVPASQAGYERPTSRETKIATLR